MLANRNILLPRSNRLRWRIVANCNSADSRQSRRTKTVFSGFRLDVANEIACALFTPCMLSGALLEAVSEAAGIATSSDVVLLSPASSGLDQSRNHPHRAERLCNAVKSIRWGDASPTPNIHGVPATPSDRRGWKSEMRRICFRFF